MKMIEMGDSAKNLLIISDSIMCYEGSIPYAFGPVVMEVRYFLDYFDTITWIGGEAEINPTFYELPSNRVRLKILPKIKAKGWKHKLGVLFNYPRMFRMLKQEIRKHEFIHVRAPSHPALGAMLLAERYPSKRFWFKYAGSWVDPASRMYDLQRKRLRRMPANCVVTVNGNWPGEAANILAFENPCLTEEHRKEGALALESKKEVGSPKRDFCFVGGWNPSKGVVPLLEAWSQLKHIDLGTLHIVGEGMQEEEVKRWVKHSSNAIKIHGLLPKEAVHQLYKNCFAVILPTRTEGFPKVIGEAMNYGCLPLVTNVSCIGQYIKTDANGVLLEKVSTSLIKEGMDRLLSYPPTQVEAMRERNYVLAEKFTYDYFMNRIQTEIFPEIQNDKRLN